MEDDVDEVAHERNVQALSKEMDLVTPQREFVVPLMKQTTRREHILSESPDTVADLLKNHPALGLPFAVRHIYICAGI